MCHITKNDAFKVRMFVVRAYEYSYIARESLYVSACNSINEQTQDERNNSLSCFIFFVQPLLPIPLQVLRIIVALDHTMRLATLGKTPLPLDQCSARRRGLYQHSTQQTKETNIRGHRRIRTFRRLTP